jgi:TolB-like protein/tRNA A-37 threonylcarbamoyl transferase component Bud32/Tfp pilus assembly protein PilF
MPMTPDALRAALADRYRIERELGGGGMSRVWVATETALDRQVVVKVIASELTEGLSAERFAREVRLAARLQQANIVPVLNAGTAAGLPYYTMPYVRGESLRARLAGGTPLGVAESVSILRDVARALAYAHGEGIVHRDIKPENVLLSHGTAVVTDFGIAKALTASRTQDGGAAATLTQAGGSIGTPAYMAPEQAVGDAVDHRTDLYAWGVMAYELLSGAHPFGRHITPQQLVTAHLTELPSPITGKNPAVPTALETLVLRCLEKDPARRPASAASVLTALDTVATPVPSQQTAAVRAPRRRMNGVLVAAGLIVAAIAVWALRPQGGNTAAPSPAAEQSLAVLPLANLSGDPADDYFGIGLAEEITRALAKNGVRVIGRVSAGALQAKGLDERAIARELGVSSLLTGTVQRAKDQIRINVTLVSANDGAVRWTEKYDRPLANVFAVQDEIARTVSETLLGSLGRRTAGTGRAETADPEAHALYLQGMVLFNRRGARQLHQAIGLFERAAVRDPKYARPQAALAMALAVLPAYVQDSTTAIVTRAVAAAERAIAMDPAIPESYVALSYGYSLLGQLDRAEQNFQRALALDSTSTAWGWYSLFAARIGDFRSAHERAARALALEPASLIARVWASQNLEQEGRFAEADSAAASAIALDSTFMLAWSWRATALLGLGQAAPAIALLERQVALLPPGRPEEPHGILAYAYAVAGRVKESRELLQTMRSQSGGRLPPTGAIAATLEELGEHAAAVALLTEAVAQHDVWTVQFPRSARYNRLRKDPRVAAMLDKLGTMP